MKLFENRKLFGLLNIVDIIVILLVLAAVAGVAVKSSVLDRMMVKSEISHVRTLFYVDDILPVAAEAAQVGDVIRDIRSGGELGVVRGIDIQDHVEPAADAQGNWHVNPVPGKKTVILTLEGDLTKYNNQFRVGQADIKVGSKMTVSADRYNYEGVIIKVEEIR
jgi:hypothetical protein